MDSTLGSLINLYTFSTGRRLFAFRQVRKLAEKLALEDLVVHLDAALTHDRATRALETKWASAPATQKNQAEVQRIDVLVDRALVSIRDSAQAQANGAGDDEDIADKVQTLISAIFPGGSVIEVTQATYVEELEAVDGILTSLKSKELAPIVTELGLTRLVKRLAKLAVDYRAAQEAPAAEIVGYDKVRAARAVGQENILQAVAMILGLYPKSTPEHQASRAKLLAPILKQNEAIRLYLRSRRTVQDVNPETGEVDPNAPVGEPAPAAGGGAPA